MSGAVIDAVGDDMVAKRILVVIRSSERDRVAEALRAALGLSLRGDAVDVVVTGAARPVLEPDDVEVREAANQAIGRARHTLIALGHRVLLGDEHLARCLRAADVVEVWT